MYRTRELAYLLALVLLPAFTAGQPANASSVHALLFFQPFCDECFAVIDEFLVPVTGEQGERLRLEPVDVSLPEGLELYRNTLQQFGLPADDGARPVLVIGDQILRGKEEILGRFPELLAQGLAAGGVALPDLPGLSAHFESGEDLPPAQEDKLALGLAWAVFAVLILVLAYAGKQAVGTGLFQAIRAQAFPTVWIPLLAIVGLGISAYLSYAELGLGEAACGPVGDCNRVQSSPYSKILGIPMAFLGTAYYAGLLALWTVQRVWVGGVADLAARLLVPAGIFGALFSLYLTSLELFVIHAVCMWCVGSALVTALLTVAVTRPASGQLETQTAVRVDTA